MANIVAEILLLAQHLISLAKDPEKYSLTHCPHPSCGKAGLWGHGYRYRKADRENEASSSLNPVPISRFYCSTCKHTCSVLPECIPPLRWYLWLIQEFAMKQVFAGMSFNKISQKISPSRWAISRWVKRLKEQFETHALHLKSKWSWLGYHPSLKEFWCALLESMSLSHAMFFLNSQGIKIPC